MNDPTSQLCELLRETLSFYEPMAIEQILMELDEHGLSAEWTMDDLKSCLEHMYLAGELSLNKERPDPRYLRTIPARGVRGKLNQWWRWTKAKLIAKS